MRDAAELARLDGVAQVELLRRGEVSAAELFEAAQVRIERLNPLLNAVVSVSERARSPARGPFEGVPFLVKDSTPWPGLRWSMGSRLFAQQTTQRQTPYGELLSRSGLVCAGKSATAELGLLSSTETLLEGATLNPWSLSHSASGSSGGSAAAVAAGLVPLAHANDGGGSIRHPASVCGVFGFKPSRGRTTAALRGSEFAAMTSDHCVTRSVRDSALFLSVTEDGATYPPIGYVTAPTTRRLRIAAFTRTMTGGEPEAAVRVAFDDAVRLLSELGHGVELVLPPTYESGAWVDALYVVVGAAVSGMVKLLDHQRGSPVQMHELEPFSWALLSRFEARGADALSVARAAFRRAARSYLDVTSSFDAVLTPTLAMTPWPLGFLSPLLEAEELIARTARAVGYTPIHNVVGSPAMSVPLYFADEHLPIGVQLAAPPGADALLLSLAYELEQARPWHDRWPPYSAPRLLNLESPDPSR
ncbi:MAG: amidase [Myxococcales bacterium]|nr:MAG: amidase [Myxococcales bacterium]